MGFPGSSGKKKKKKKEHLPVQETYKTQVQSLGWEDPLEEGMATHSSVLENPMYRGAWLATDHRVIKSRTWLKQLRMHTLHSDLLFIHKIFIECLDVGNVTVKQSNPTAALLELTF